MDDTRLTLNAYTPFAELDLLLGEEQYALVAPAPLPRDVVPEPERVDAFNAQILAGLVSP